MSYSLDPETVEYVEKTKGKLSASERVNQLLRRAIVAEQYQLLEQEAAVVRALRDNLDKLQAQAADLVHTDAVRYLQGPARRFDKSVIHANRSNLNLQVFDSKLLNQIMLDGLSGFGAQAAHTLVGVVSRKSCEIHARDGS